MSEYELSTDPGRLQLDILHPALAATYWSPNVRRDVVETAIKHSIVIGAYAPTQVAFARVVTDYATFAWLCDVWVDPAHRGHGISKRMVAELIVHPRLQTLRRWCLATADAHTLYSRFGFEPVPADRWMQLVFDPKRWSAIP